MIAMLRDPVERAHSNWAHLWSAGLDPIGDFVRACADEDRRVAAGWAQFWHYTRLGRYGEQLEHLYQVFPEEQVLVLRYRDLVHAPVQTLDQICGFLGVGQGVVTEVPRENVTAHPDESLGHRAVSSVIRAAAAASRHLPGTTGTALTSPLERMLQRGARPRQPLTWEQRQAVLPYFESDIRLLEKVTEADFSDWLQPRERSAGWSATARSGSARPVTAGPVTASPAWAGAAWASARTRAGRRARPGYASAPGRSSVRSSCEPSGRVIS